MNRSCRSERGAAAVELGLVLLPLLLLLLGIVEFGRVYYTQLRLQHAAQEAVREIALHYDDPGLTEGGIAAIATNLLADALENVVGDVTASITEMTLCSTGGTTERARVVLREDVDLVLPLPESRDWDTVTVTGAATMRCKG